jgi:hypothetical protein
MTAPRCRWSRVAWLVFPTTRAVLPVGFTDAAGPTPSIDDDPTQRRAAPGSDHRPVLASIDL